jgi:hypothetical protein
MIPPTGGGDLGACRGFWVLSVFFRQRLRPVLRVSMSYIRLGFQPGSSGKSRALEKDAPARPRRNRNAYEASAIWRVVSLNYREFAAFLLNEIDRQPELRSRFSAPADGAGSCGVGREDYHRLDQRPARPVVRRRVVLDRGGLPHCGADCVSGPEPDSADHGVLSAIDAGRRIKRGSRYEIVTLHIHLISPNHPPSPRSASRRAGRKPT